MKDIVQLVRDNGTLDEYAEQMVDLVKNHPDKLLQVPQVVRYFLEKKDIKILKVLETHFPEYPELREFIFKFDIVNSYVKAKYFPYQDKIEVYENFIYLQTAEFKVPSDKRNLLKALNENKDFSIDLDFSLNPKSIFLYQVKEKDDTKKIIKKASPVVTLALASAMIFNTLTGCSDKLKLDSWFKENFGKNSHKKAHKVPVESVLRSLTSGISEIEKIEGSDKAISKFNEILPEEVDYIMDLAENEEDPLKLQKKYRQVSESQLSRVISETQRAQILAKNIKKIKTDDEIKHLSSLILKHSIDWNIDHRIIAAILKQETGFDQGKTNHTGDLSMMQINYPIWSEEFERIGLKLDQNRLKNDVEYGFWVMGIVLSMKKKSNLDDPYWFARYHSNTPKRKQVYLSLLENHFDDFNSVQINLIKNKLDEFIGEVKALDYHQNKDINPDKIDMLVNRVIQLRYSLDNKKIPIKMASL